MHTYFATFFSLQNNTFYPHGCFANKSQPFFIWKPLQVEPPIMRMFGTILGHTDVRDSREWHSSFCLNKFIDVFPKIFAKKVSVWFLIIWTKVLLRIQNFWTTVVASKPKYLNKSLELICLPVQIAHTHTHTHKAQRFVQKYIPVDMDVCSIMCRNNKEIVAWTPKFSFVEDDLPASDYRKEVEAQKRWSLFCHPETHNRLCVISTYCIGMIGPTIHTAYWSHCFPR